MKTKWKNISLSRKGNTEIWTKKKMGLDILEL